jgi:hypothetical protein
MTNQPTVYVIFDTCAYEKQRVEKCLSGMLRVRLPWVLLCPAMIREEGVNFESFQAITESVMTGTFRVEPAKTPHFETFEKQVNKAIESIESTLNNLLGSDDPIPLKRVGGDSEETIRIKEKIQGFHRSAKERTKKKEHRASWELISYLAQGPVNKHTPDSLINKKLNKEIRLSLGPFVEWYESFKGDRGEIASFLALIDRLVQNPHAVGVFVTKDEPALGLFNDEDSELRKKVLRLYGPFSQWVRTFYEALKSSTDSCQDKSKVEGAIRILFPGNENRKISKRFLKRNIAERYGGDVDTFQNALKEAMGGESCPLIPVYEPSPLQGLDTISQRMVGVLPNTFGEIFDRPVLEDPQAIIASLCSSSRDA